MRYINLRFTYLLTYLLKLICKGLLPTTITLTEDVRYRPGVSFISRICFL